MPRSKDQQARTAEMYQRIAAMNDCGLIDDEIAKRLGVSTSTVERGRRAMGLKKKPPYKGFPSKLNAETKKWIKENYLKVNDTIMAEKFGVSESTMINWRKKLGLKYENKHQWDRYPHPKGMKGKKHSEEVVRGIRKRSKAMWQDPNFIGHTEEYRQMRSDNSSRHMARRHPSTIRSRGKAGYREDLGAIYFRSLWEANYARYLNLLKSRGDIFYWEYEPDTFWFEAIRRGVRSYKPDFKVWDTEESEPYYIEIKGYMDAKSKTKLNRMRIYYPKVKLLLVTEKEYRGLRDVAALIPNWEACKKSRF